MEMSVKAGGQAVTVEQPKSKPTDRSNASDLDLWLEQVEAMGELKRITAEVSPDLEAAHITYLVGLEKSPALLFENIKGHPGGRLLFNPFGSSLNRFALSIQEEPGRSAIELVKALKEKMKRRIPPTLVDASTAPVNQNIDVGDQVDVTKFPAPHMWPLDGGKYIGTGDMVITTDPESGRVNVGTYRQMIQSPKQVATAEAAQGISTARSESSGDGTSSASHVGRPPTSRSGNT